MAKGNSALLLFLSKYNPNSSEKAYRYKNQIFKGIQTNDAPCKAMLREANENEYPVRRILCIASGEVMTSVTETGETQLENFREMIVDYAMNDLEYEKKPEIIAIPYDFTSENEMQDLDSSPRVLRVYQDIADHLWKQKTPVIYIDYTGGMRDISLLMMTVIRHLEWIGVSCKRIVYSNWEDLTIYDIGYIYEMLRLIDSTNNFVFTGTARNLRRLFAGLEREGSAGWDETNAALESLEKFSDAISLCDISDIGALASDMNRKLREVMDLPNDVSSIYLRMFKTLIPQICEKMYADRWNDQSEIYFSLISWAAENMMLQQALTLYVEKMPVVYMDERNVFRRWIPDYVVFSSDTADSQFYEDLFSGIRSYGSLEREFADILKNIRNICAENGLNDFDEIRGVIQLQRGEILLRQQKGELSRDKAEKLDNGLHRLLVYLNRFSLSGMGARIYGRNVPERTIGAFIRSAVGNRRYQHYFLFSNQAEYDASHSPGNNGQRQTGGAFTYRTKIQALKRLEQESGEQAQKLLEIMQYYLAVKYLRNKMNHASEQTDTEDEAALKEYLSGSAHINPEMRTENIQSIIQNGLRISGWKI